MQAYPGELVAKVGRADGVCRVRLPRGASGSLKLGGRRQPRGWWRSVALLAQLGLDPDPRERLSALRRFRS
jgi:hypothetical protein